MGKKILLTVSLALAAGLGLFYWIGLPVLVEHLVRGAIEEADATMGPVAFSATDVGLGGTQITGLSLRGGDITLAEVNVTYAPLSLLAGRIGTVSLKGLRLRGRYDENGLSLPFPLSSGDGGGGFSTAGLPFSHAEISNSILTLLTPGGAVTARLDGSVENKDGDLTATFHLNINGRGVGGQARGTLSLTKEKISGQAEAFLSAKGFVLPGSGERLSGEGRFTLAGDGDGITVIAKKPVTLSFTMLPPEIIKALPENLRTPLIGALSMTLAPFELSAVPKPEGPRLSVPLSLAVKVEDGMDLSLAGLADVRISDSLSLSLSALTLDLTQLTINNRPVEAHVKEAALSLSGEGPTLDASIGYLFLPTISKHPLPVSLKLHAREKDGQVVFTGSALGRDNPLNLTFAGRHDRQAGTGSAEVTMAPLVFAVGGLQPSDFHPALIERMQEVSGTAGLGGTVRWTRDRLSPDLVLLLQDMSFSHGFISIRRLNTALKVSGFTPLTTPGRQEMAVGAIGAGIPLTDALISFHLNEKSRLLVEKGILHFAGGTITVADQDLPTDGSETELTLKVDGVKLDQVARIADLSGLSATGTLSGTVPITVHGGDVQVRDATLKALGPGTLSYVGEGLDAGNQGAAIAWTALSDFRYNDLRLTLNGRTSGELTIGIHLSGSNPALYDGYPVKLNLTISGKLTQALTEGLESYQIPDRIREKMMKFGKAK